MDRGARKATVHRVTKSQTQLKHVNTEYLKVKSLKNSCPILAVYVIDNL